MRMVSYRTSSCVVCSFAFPFLFLCFLCLLHYYFTGRNCDWCPRSRKHNEANCLEPSKNKEGSNVFFRRCKARQCRTSHLYLRSGPSAVNRSLPLPFTLRPRDGPGWQTAISSQPNKYIATARPDPEAASSRSVGLVRRSPGRPLRTLARRRPAHPDPAPDGPLGGHTRSILVGQKKCQEKGTGPPVQGIFITLRLGDAGRSGQV